MSVLVPTLAEFQALQAQTALLTGGGGGSAFQPFIWYGNSGNLSEKVTHLPLTNAKYVVYSIKLPNCAEGDLIKVRATFEVTNPYNYNIMVGRGFIIAKTATAVTGTEISEYATRNITPGMHHDHIQDFGSIRATAAMSGNYVNFVAYSGSSAAGSGHKAIVEQDYGRLEVERIRAWALEN